MVLAGALLLSGCGGESSGEVVGTADPRASAGASVSADSAASSSASSTGYEGAQMQLVALPAQVVMDESG